MLSVVCQLSRDVIGYEDSNVISALRSVFLSQLNSHLFLKIVGYQSFPSLSVLFESVNKSEFARYEHAVVGRWLS